MRFEDLALLLLVVIPFIVLPGIFWLHFIFTNKPR